MSKRIIEVRRYSHGVRGELWKFWCKGVGWNDGYASAEHAMRDAWTWCGGDVPAVIYT